MQLYILEWSFIDEWDSMTGVLGVYSTWDLAEKAYLKKYKNNPDYESEITVVTLDEE